MHRVPLLTFFAILLAGCPEKPPSSSNDAGTDPPDASVFEMGMAADVASVDAARSVTLVIEPVEVGLFGESAPDDAIEIELEVGDGVEFEWPPGLYRYGLQLETDPIGDTEAVVRGLSDASEWSSSLEPRTAFVPAQTKVRVEVEGGADLRFRIQRVGDTAGLAEDSPGHAGRVGAWFDDVWAIHDSDDPGAVVVQTMDALRRHGGPIETERGFLFIAPAQDGESPPQVRGTWNDWEADPASELVSLGPGLRARFIDVPEGTHAYKLYYPDGDAWVTDRANRHVAWDGIDTGTVGDFNSVLRPGEDASRLVWFPEVRSSELDNSRDVYVQVPPGYDTSDQSFPTLYLHDGNESISRGRFHIVGEETAAAEPATAAILVYVALPTQDVRIVEYTMATADSRGDAYARFVADELVGFVDERFRTDPRRDARGVAGASLGGLISYWIAMQHPAMFGYAAGMSSSFFWEDQHVIDAIQPLGCQDVTYYLDSGSPNDNYEVTRVMRDTLEQMDCDVRYVLEEGGQHDWSYWEQRFDGVLRHFAETNGQ